MTTLSGSLPLITLKCVNVLFKESVPQNGMGSEESNNDCLCFEYTILLMYSFLKFFDSPRQLFLQLLFFETKFNLT